MGQEVETGEDEAPPPAPEAFAPLDPRQLWVIRIRLGLLAIPLLIAAAALDAGPLRETAVPAGLAPGIVLLLAIAAVAVLPRRRYRAWGYRMEGEELHIRRGLLVRVRTAVPFGRVQHIDVAQGPIERAFGLGTLILHTAGTRGAAVGLPGLAHERAEDMRDRIRAKIRQDLV